MHLCHIQYALLQKNKNLTFKNKGDPNKLFQSGKKKISPMVPIFLN